MLCSTESEKAVATIATISALRSVLEEEGWAPNPALAPTRWRRTLESQVQCSNQVALPKAEYGAIGAVLREVRPGTLGQP